MELSALAGGALQEEFLIQLQNLLRNIADPNTVPGTVHKLGIVFELRPTLDRDRVRVVAKFTGHVPPGIAPVETTLDLYPAGSVVEAIEVFTPRQTNLFTQEKHNATAID